jgi:hypothetical protein
VWCFCFVCLRLVYPEHGTHKKTGGELRCSRMVPASYKTLPCSSYIQTSPVKALREIEERQTIYVNSFRTYQLLTQKLLKQDYVAPRLKSSLQKFYSSHHNLVDHYKISVCRRVLFLIFIRCRFQCKCHDRKQTIECRQYPLLQAYLDR